MPEITTDDPVYRVDPVWLGPPGLTAPFRARYVAWGTGMASWVVIFTLARMWFDFSLWSVGWSLVLAIALTRVVCGRITHERGLTAVLTMFVRELATPRHRTRGVGGAAAATRVRVETTRAAPCSSSRSRGRTATPFTPRFEREKEA